jgi:8-oxo-dGTP pyrophosphatase MutT (NUDIX family)
MPDSIHLTVAAVIYRDGNFLMVRERDGGREVINQPAGHVEPGETLQQAMLREAFEETGWHIKLTGFLGISHFTSANNGKTYYRVSFVAEPLREDKAAEIDKDIIACEWLNVEQISGCGCLRSPLVLSDIKLFLKNNIYPIDIIKNLNSDTGL